MNVLVVAMELIEFTIDFIVHFVAYQVWFAVLIECLFAKYFAFVCIGVHSNFIFVVGEFVYFCHFVAQTISINNNYFFSSNISNREYKYIFTASFIH